MVSKPYSGHGEWSLMENRLNTTSAASLGALTSARIDLADFLIPHTVDVILVARHYHPTFGGLQNFTLRLAAALRSLGRQPLVVSVEEALNTKSVPTTSADQFATEVRLIAEDRSLFWHRLPTVIEASDNATVVLAVGLEQKQTVSAQLHALAKIASSGRITILRIATTGDFACRVDTHLVEACKHLQAIVVLNLAMQAEVEATLPPDSSCIVQWLPVIGSGLSDSTDTSALRLQWRREHGISPSAFVALWAGRPVRRKRLRKLLRIWCEANIDGILVLAGVDPDSESREVGDVIRWIRWHTSMDIRLIPPLSLDGMTTLYSAADCFLFTSEREGMSNAVVEAISHGLPVFASDIPGVRDILIFDESAALQLFTDTQENDFVQAIQGQAAKHPFDQHRRQRNPEAWQIFGATAVAKRYLELFERVRHKE